MLDNNKKVWHGGRFFMLITFASYFPFFISADRDVGIEMHGRIRISITHKEKRACR